MIVSDLNKLFLNCSKKKLKNDRLDFEYGDTFVWRYHGNIIATRNKNENFIKIYKGWYKLSVTTKRRLNNFPFFAIYSKRGGVKVVKVWDKFYNAFVEKEFVDGMEIPIEIGLGTRFRG